MVDIKIIAKYALDTLASGVILAHNHPSGNMTPSSADKQITRKVKSALNLIDVELFDHLIIHPSKLRYYSFANDGECRVLKYVLKKIMFQFQCGAIKTKERLHCLC